MQLLHNTEILHRKALAQYMQPDGQFYIGDHYRLCIKCHPTAERISEKLKETYPDAIYLPAHIPLELLCALGCNPAKVGGFMSTAYLAIEKEKLADVIFMTLLDEKLVSQSDIFSKQFELARICNELGLINSDLIHSFEEL